MRYCFNLNCGKPENSEHEHSCAFCHEPLVLNGRYTALKVLGEGGFGRTYLGVDLLRSNATCAIKQLLSRDRFGNPLDPHSRNLFRREAEQLKRLGGDSQIPSFIDFFEVRSTLYLVLEYIQGETLTSLVYRNKRVNVFKAEHVVEFLDQMLTVLEKVHRAGVVHRDIKPDNVMLRSGVYVLIDFGGSRVLSGYSQLPPTGTVLASGHFSPPEQLQGKPTFASDIYSLGVTCLFLLTGRLPQDLHDAYSGRWQWRPFLGQNQISNSLAVVLEGMIAAPLQERFSSVGQVRNALFSPVAHGIPSKTGKTVAVGHPLGSSMPQARGAGSNKSKGGRGASFALFVLSVVVTAAIYLKGGAVFFPPLSSPTPTVSDVEIDDSSSASSLTSSSLPETPRHIRGTLDDFGYRYEGLHLAGKPDGDGVRVSKYDGTKESGEFIEGTFVSGTLTKEDGTIERGKFREGLLDTKKGERISPDKGKEIGVFEGGNLIRGEKVLADGTRLKGSFQYGKLDGKDGVKILMDKTRFEGEFVQDELREGKLILPSGDVHQGTFRNGKLDGKGKITSSDGTVTEGTFRDGEFNGEGKITRHDGAILEGTFEDGKLQGKGKITSSDGTVTEGTFRDGEFNGKGKITRHDGAILEGTFEDGKLDGEGKITSSDGTVTKGTFRDGELSGEGKITDPNGTVLEGTFEDGKLNGKGKTVERNGTVLIGEFKDGTLEGVGEFTYPDGRKQKVKWDGKTYQPANPFEKLWQRIVPGS